MINWNDPTYKVTPNFTVHELLYLPTWGRMANSDDGLNDKVKLNLTKLAAAMEGVRQFVGSPIHVHVTYRPSKYNTLIGGSNKSSHIKGLAMDFDVAGVSCKEVITKILESNKLVEWGMYMENNGDSPTWIHLNLFDGVKRSRYFKP